ncbi:MAG: hypothetical protein KJ580_03170 [Nanoarchaeota archaeon]|nr:hypothetical protein [Nanoarchaeota archaeon]
MIEYNLVKYCRWCKKRFVVDKGKVRMIYCTECQKKVLAEKEKNKEN